MKFGKEADRAKIARQEIWRLGNHIWLPAKEDVTDEEIMTFFLKDDLAVCKAITETTGDTQ